MIGTLSKLVQAVSAISNSVATSYIVSNSSATMANSFSDVPVMQPFPSILPVNISDKTSVPATSFKETMSCGVSPLRFNLPLSVKEKIWKGDFAEVLALLPSARAREFSSRYDTKSEDKSEEGKYMTRSYFNWLQAYCIFSSVLAERNADLCCGLFQHLEHVIEAYKYFGGMGWFQYDKSFCQKLSIHSLLKWGIKDIGLWLNLIVPQKPPISKQVM